MYESVNYNGDKTENLESLIYCVQNILNTNKGSLPFRRDFGLNLDEFLFQPYDFFYLKLIEAEIKRQIKRNCPHVIINYYESNFNPDSESYEVNIGLTSENITDIYNLSTSFKIKNKG